MHGVRRLPVRLRPALVLLMSLSPVRAVRWVLVGPAVLAVSAIVLVPLFLLSLLSFQEYSPSNIWTGRWTAANYLRMLTDGYYLSVLWQTIRVGLVTTLCCIVIGYPVAYHLSQARGMLRGVCLFLLLCPLLVSTVIRTFGWVVLLGDRGIVTQLVRSLGFSSFKLLGTEAAVVLGMTHFLLPFLVLPLAASMERIPKELRAAARNLGSSRVGSFFRIVVPLSIPGLVVGSLLVYAMTISAVVTPVLLGGGRVHMLGPQIYEHVLVTYNWPFAASLSMTIIVLTVVVFYFVNRVSQEART